MAPVITAAGGSSNSAEVVDEGCQNILQRENSDQTAKSGEYRGFATSLERDIRLAISMDDKDDDVKADDNIDIQVREGFLPSLRCGL